MLFHKTLQKNQIAIKESNISSQINIENRYYNENENKQPFFEFLKKDFANRLLAFFQKFSITNETVIDGFTHIPMKDLFSTNQFLLFLNEFCRENRILDKDKFFRECFRLLEKNSLGKIVDNNYIEIKIDDVRIKSEIINLLKTHSNDGVAYKDIFDHISTVFKKFFMDDYIKFVLTQLLEKCVIQKIGQNLYQII